MKKITELNKEVEKSFEQNVVSDAFKTELDALVVKYAPANESAALNDKISNVLSNKATEIKTK